jgi:hypothetical protein
MRIFPFTLAAIGVVSRVAAAEPPASSFSAFDLAAGKLVVRPVPSTAAAGPQLAARNCTTKPVDGTLTIERSPDPSCTAIFDMRQPHDLGLDVTSDPKATPAVITAFNLAFEVGLADLVRAEYEAADHRIDLHNAKLSGTLVYVSNPSGRWAKLELTKGIATLASSDDVAPETRIYVRTGSSDAILAVEWRAKPPEPLPPRPPNFETTCKDELARAKHYAWVSYVDAANPTASLRVVRDPSAPDDRAAVPSPIVEPSGFGLVLVHHAESLVVTFDSGTAALTLPKLASGVGQSGPDSGPGLTEAKAAPGTKYVCSTYQVPPHPPGAFQVKLKMIDPAKSGTSALSERSLDVIVLQRYAGAFRAGLAGIFGAPDQKFEARTAPGSSQAEIVRSGYTPAELVLGYSVYFSGLSGPGRSYFTSQGVAGQDSHLGAYLGFGVVSVTSTSVDYLKSLHVGLEYEFSPYFAVAVTGVIRRVDELAAGAHVGGPAAGTIPIASSYAPGVAVVLNISPSFFKFASEIAR